MRCRRSKPGGRGLVPVRSARHGARRRAWLDVVRKDDDTRREGCDDGAVPNRIPRRSTPARLVTTLIRTLSRIWFLLLKVITMAITRQVITSLGRDGNDLLGSKNLAIKIADENIVSGSLLTVESNHFCVLKSRGAVLNVYETGQYQIITPDKPILGSIVQGFFGGSSPWVYEVIYINRSKLLISSQGVATSAEMAEMAYHADYYVHVDTTAAALDLITHLPFNGNTIDLAEIAAYAGPAVGQAINQVVQVTRMEEINEHIHDIRENVKVHLTDFLRVYGITLNDLKILIMPKDERMRELISLQAIGLSATDAVRYYLALRMADRGLVSAPNAAAGLPFMIGGAAAGVYALKEEAGLPAKP